MSWNRPALAAHIKALTVLIAAPLDLKKAMVALGRVDTKQINPHTMASRITPNLSFPRPRRIQNSEHHFVPDS